MRNRCLIANWKMNLPSAGIETYLRWLASLPRSNAEIVIAPPFPFLGQIRAAVDSGRVRVSVAAQNCSDQASGAFTGEVSAAMIRKAGGTHVIVGHSERRTLFNEADDLVGQKMRAGVDAGLTVILCVGETESERERGETEGVLDRQLKAAFDGLNDGSSVMVAYEPVWAIGTGKNATTEQAADAHRYIRRRLPALARTSEWTILYGGSVTPENASGLLRSEEIDGFLVGGASLDPQKFVAIYDALRRR